jgi:hypothetical protein
MNVGAVCKQYVHYTTGYVWFFSDMPKKIRKVISELTVSELQNIPVAPSCITFWV